MLISIVIPVYNIEDSITHSLEAVCCQTYKNVELILVDDGSVDRSILVAEDYLQKKDMPYKVISQNNQGPSAARNTGIKASSGDWCICLDGDDYIAPDTLACMSENAICNKVDCVFCGFKYVTNDNVKLSPQRYGDVRVLNALDFRTAFFKRKIKPIVPGMLLKRTVYDKIMYDEQCRYCEDILFLWELLYKLDRFVFIETDFYNYYQRPGSTMHSLKPGKYLSSSIRHKISANEIVNNNPNDTIAKLIYPKFRLAALSIVCWSNSYSVFRKTVDDDGGLYGIPNLLKQTDARLWIFAFIFCLSKRLFYFLSKFK